MWQLSAVLVSCVLAAAGGDQFFDRPKEYIERLRRASAITRSPVYVEGSVPFVLGTDVPVPGRTVRGTSDPFEVQKYRGFITEQNVPNIIVKSSPLNIKVPASRKYYNPALKRARGPFGIDRPFPFQEEKPFGRSVYPFQVGYDNEFTLGEGDYRFQPDVALTEYAASGFPVGDFERTPVTASRTQKFSSRPPWIPRGGTTDVKPQRANLILPNGTLNNQVSVSMNNRPGVSLNSLNIADLIRQVDQLISTGNQNTNQTTASFKRFKHPSL